MFMVANRIPLSANLFFVPLKIVFHKISPNVKLAFALGIGRAAKPNRRFEGESRNPEKPDPDWKAFLLFNRGNARINFIQPL
jgi:hypothetical protein